MSFVVLNTMLPFMAFSIILSVVTLSLKTTRLKYEFLLSCVQDQFYEVLLVQTSVSLSW